MNEIQTLIDALTKKEKLVAMLAPSFPIVYEYPAIITKLRKLGFAYVAEVAAGAEKTNEQLAKLLADNPDKRYITSPCPTVVRMVKKQLPQFEKYFTVNVDSPMVATAKMVIEKYPGYRPVFIGPCIVKKLESSEDVPELNILVLNYSEMDQVFAHFNLTDEPNPSDSFDIAAKGPTRIYPMDGGLAQSSGVLKQFPPGAVKIVSTTIKDMEAIKSFETDTSVRLLDILFCDGGCISGPGIKSPLTKEQRRQKVVDFAKYPAPEI